MPRTAPPLTETPIIRKLYTIGRGYALYLPAQWVNANVDPNNLHVTVTFTNDGSFTVRPLKLPQTNRSRL